MAGSGIVDDFVSSISESLNDFLKEKLASVITKMVSFMNDNLSSTYASASDSSSSGMTGIFLTSHPYDFTYNSHVPGSYRLWGIIKNVCDNAVVPIAGYILVIVLLNDLIQMLIRGNNLKDFDETVMFKWIIKSFCGITLVNNTYDIASGLFSFGVDVTSNSLGALFGSSINAFNADNFNAVLENLLLDDLLVLILPVFLVMLLVICFSIVIIVVMASRIIEVFMYLGISPIPMATLMNETWSGIGKNWIRSILALSFQSFFIVLCLGIFKTMYNEAILSIMALTPTTGGSAMENSAADASAAIMAFLMLAGFAGALIFTMLRSGQISKSIFNAG